PQVVLAHVARTVGVTLRYQVQLDVGVDDGWVVDVDDDQVVERLRKRSELRVTPVVALCEDANLAQAHDRHERPLRDRPRPKRCSMWRPSALPRTNGKITLVSSR